MSNKDKVSQANQKVRRRAGRAQDINIIQSFLDQSTKLLKPKEIVLNLRAKNSQPNTHLDIGLISREVSINNATKAVEGKELRIHNRNRHYKITVASCIETIKTAHSDLLEKIKVFLQDGVTIICVNELGYPNFTVPSGATFYELKKQLELADKHFREELVNLAHNHDAIILAGSYHNAKDLKNKAVLFYRNESNGLTPERFIEHEKLTSAKSENVGEVIRTPSTRQWPIYITRLGSLAVLICLDAYDLNVFFRQMEARFTSGKSRPDIVLVPSYSPKSLHRICQNISYACNNVVVYVNHAATDQKPYSAVYVSGKSIDISYDVTERIGRAEVSWIERTDLMHKNEIDNIDSIFSELF